MKASPRIWLLIGYRKGDNNQLFALAEALGLPFETRTTLSGRLAPFLTRLFPVGIAHVHASCRRWLVPPWPDVVIGVGRRTVPVARWIRKRSGGRTRLIRVGNPRARNSLFDLVITTRQYPVRAGDNVVTLPLAMSRFRAPPEPTVEERAWLEARPRPHLLLSLGGTAPMWRLDIPALRAAAVELGARARALGGTLIVIGSPRTPAEAIDTVNEALADCSSFRFAEGVRFAVLLNDADEQFVTADSISMISEAVMTGKPVGLIPIEPDERGRRRLGPDPERSKIRDPRRFWADLGERALVGTVEKPRRGTFEDPVALAVAAVRATLEPRNQPDR